MQHMLAFVLAASLPFVILPTPERAWLEDFYNMTCGTVWKQQDGWLSSDDACSWYGVVCDETNTSLRELWLSANHLGKCDGGSHKSTLPSFDRVTKLESINLGGNLLKGIIPPLPATAVRVDLGGQTSPRPEDVGLTGHLPNLSNLPELRYMDVRFNHISGTVPVLDRVPQLEELLVNENLLSGYVPPMSTVPRLTKLRVGGNALSGTIPDLNLMAGLYFIDFDRNQLSGTVPPLSFASLKYLQVSDNLKISGTIPSLSNLPSAVTLYLTSTALSGTLPALDHLPLSVEVAILASNHLSGTIPLLASLTGLKKLNLGSNALSGTVPSFLSSQVLTDLNLQANHLSGHFPQPPTSLEYLDLSCNGGLQCMADVCPLYCPPSKPHWACPAAGCCPHSMLNFKWAACDHCVNSTGCGTWVQRKCTDAKCTSCTESTVSFRKCFAISASPLAKSISFVSCSAAGLLQILYNTTDCSGEGRKDAAPIGQCVKSDNAAGWIDNVCLGHDNGNRIRQETVLGDQQWGYQSPWLGAAGKGAIRGTAFRLSP